MLVRPGFIRHGAIGVATLLLTVSVHAGPVSVTLTSVEETFGLAAQPGATFGSGGGLNVSGTDSANGDGVMQGVTDSWLKFDTSVATATFDATWGVGNWTLTTATLSLREVATPNSPIFNRGVGAFEVRWVASDDWSEGTGAPAGPGVATGNEIGYAYGLSILDGALDRTLGTFTNAGANLRQDFALDLDVDFAADAATGGDTSLYLTAADAGIGFTFNASGMNAPWLVLEATPVPAAPAWLVLLAAGAARRRRRRG